MVVGVGVPCGGVCIDVSCDDIVSECVEVLECVCDIGVFCCVIRVGGLSGGYVDVRYV